MSDTKHSPLPWTVDHGEATKIRDRKGGCVCIISQTGHGGKFGGLRPKGEADANATLIEDAVNRIGELEGTIETLSQIIVDLEQGKGTPQ